MRWSAATGGIGRCRRRSIGCGRSRRSTAGSRWTCNENHKRGNGQKRPEPCTGRGALRGRQPGSRAKVSKLGLNAIILHELPNQGRTVIEKFEGSVEVGFAVVLLTPDDVAYPRDRPS